MPQESASDRKDRLNLVPKKEKPSVKAPTQEPGESYESYKEKLKAFNEEQKKSAPPSEPEESPLAAAARKKKEAAAKAQADAIKENSPKK